MDVPCGFPIVTQMRSSSSFEMPMQYEVGRQNNNYAIGSQSFSMDDERSDELKKELGIEDTILGETFRVPIRDSSFKLSSSGKDKPADDCFCLAAEEINHEQNLAVIMTVRYYDEIYRERQCNNIRDEDRSMGQQDHDDNDTIYIRTSVTTVAIVSIHVSLPNKPFQTSNAGSDVQLHRIVLSATNITDEVDRCIESDDNNLNVSVDKKSDNNVEFRQASYHHEYVFADIQPQIAVSSNGKHIACLIPRPIRQHPKENLAFEKNEGMKAKGDNKATTPSGIPGSRSLSKLVSMKKTPKISTVVILNLEPPTMETNISNTSRDNGGMVNIAASDMDRLPLPHYLQMNGSNDEGESHNHQQGQENRSRSSLSEEVSDTCVLPITRNYRIVTLNPISTSATKELSNLLSQITCIVDLNHNRPNHASKNGTSSSRKVKNAPILLAGCNDGSIIMIAYKSAMALGVAYQNQVPSTVADSPPKSTIVSDVGWERHDVGLRVLRYIMDDSRHCEGREGQGNELEIKGNIIGKLLGIQRDGSLVMFDTEFQDGRSTLNSDDVEAGRSLSRTISWESKTYSFRLTLKPKTKLHGNLSNMYANGCFVDSNTIAVLVKPLIFERRGNILQFQNTFSQVWSIDPRHSGAKLIARLSLDHEKLEGMQHGNFWFPDIPSSNLVSSSTISSTLPLQSHIEYDNITGSLSISSAIPLARSTRSNGVFARLFISIWDWRSCTIGFSLMSDEKVYCINRNTTFHGQQGMMSPIQLVTSRHYFSRINGVNTLVHLYSKYMRYKRDIYNVGVLSPSQSRSHIGHSEASNPVFLTRDQVMYPGASEVTTNKEIKIKWKQSIIPGSYAKKYGPITMASTSEKFGRSLIVVGSKGFCILDIHKGDAMKSVSDDIHFTQLPTSCAEGFECHANHSFLKSNINRWRMFQRSNENKFRVLTFTWWEGIGRRNEDVIIAVVDYCDEKDGLLYLVAWSTLCLKVGNLIFGFGGDNGSNKGNNKGVPLPNSFVPHKASILVKPNYIGGEDQAVLLLVGNKSRDTYQTLIQLQVQTSRDNHNVHKIITRIANEGQLSSISLNTCHIFLAGCTFQNMFNIRKVEDRPIAILGVLEDNGLCLSAIKIAQNGEAQKTTVVDFWKKSSSSHRITHFWQDEFAPHTSEDEEIVDNGAWTWTFLKTSGEIFTWAIGVDEDNQTQENDFPFALHRSVHPPTWENGDERGTSIQTMFTYGIISDENKSVKASNSDESTLLVGTLPIKGHRHLLFTGQHIYRSEVSVDLPPAFLTNYGLSNFDVGIPCSTGSILLTLSLLSKYRLTGDDNMAEKLFFQICRYIRSLNHSEASCAILRTITSYVTQIVSKKSMISPAIECERKLFLRTIQSTLARVASSILTQIQFVSLFFNVGRQLEPHHFKSLFPIIFEEGDSSGELSIQDCFDIAVEKGSFSVPSAALPLFTNKQDAHSLSINLLHHCATQVFRVCNPHSLDVRCLREECQSIHQLYSYLRKLEESETNAVLKVSTEESCTSQKTHDSTLDVHDHHFPEEEFSMIDSTGSSYDHFRHETVAKSPRISNIASIIVRPFSRFRTKRNQKEDEIFEAATSFIKSTCNFDDVCSIQSEQSHVSISDSQSDTSVISEKGDVTEYFENEDRALFSASGILALAIVSKLFLLDDFSPDVLSFGLRSIGTLCLLLRDDDIPSFNSITVMDCIHGLLSKITNNDLIISLEALEEWHSERERTAVESLEESFHLSEFMQLLLVQASNEWNDQIAFAVVKVISSVLDKQNESPEIAMLSPLLSLVIAIAIDVASHSSSFLTSLEDCAITDFISFLKIS